MTNLGPLTTTFTPNGADCNSTFIGANSNTKWLQYGAGAISSGDCLPSGFMPYNRYFYSPGVCPSGYTEACYTQSIPSTRNNRPETRITCCPTWVLNFSKTLDCSNQMKGYCRSILTSGIIDLLLWLSSSYQCAGPHDDTQPFACKSFFAGNMTFGVSSFLFLSNAIESRTTTEVWVDYFIVAEGPVVYIAERESTSPTTTTGNLSSSSQSSSGRTRTDVFSSVPRSSSSSAATSIPSNSDANNSSGIVVGVTVGIVLAGLLLIVGSLALIIRLIRRRRCLRTSHPASTEIKPQQTNPDALYDSQQMQQFPYELQTKPEQRYPYELNAMGNWKGLGNTITKVQVSVLTIESWIVSGRCQGVSTALFCWYTGLEKQRYLYTFLFSWSLPQIHEYYKLLLTLGDYQTRNSVTSIYFYFS